MRARQRGRQTWEVQHEGNAHQEGEREAEVDGVGHVEGQVLGRLQVRQRDQGEGDLADDAHGVQDQEARVAAYQGAKTTQ